MKSRFPIKLQWFYFGMLTVVAIGTTGMASEPIIDPNAVDPTVDPCQDFYHYACGNWLKNFKLPADRAAYNRQVDGLGEETLEKLSSILDNYANGRVSVPARYAPALGTYYASCMDTANSEKTAQEFIQSQFLILDMVRNSEDLAKTIAALQLEGVNAFFILDAEPDFSDSSRTIAHLSQGGMSFADKSYYFDADPKSAEIRDRFVDHATRILELAGEAASQAGQEARFILDFETKLADKALRIEEMQDSTKLDHPTDLSGITGLAPRLDWQTYLAAIGIPAAGKFNVKTPDFFQGLNAIFAQYSPAQIKIYLKWQILHAFAPVLSRSFADENFAFWEAYLAGKKRRPERWKECTQFTGAAMSDALGEAYVNSFPDPNAIRSSAEEMVQRIKTAFGDDLERLDWLDAQTRAAARKKLSMVADKVGYPDRWRSFDGLTLAPNDFIGDSRAVAVFTNQRELAKIGKPTDRVLWDMMPWEQNAYYDPPSNEMVFPLGALVPPIFDLGASEGANFGSIGGGWMGHELTHGFDSDGRNYDGQGNLTNWWSDQTAQEFSRRTRCLMDQADQYQVLPGLYVNGQQTLTENLADQGGVKIGYIAFQAATAGHPPAPAVGPFNERQQYWVAYAQSWCTQETPEHIRLQVTTDVHPPAEFRTNAVLFNRPEFAADFGCERGSHMAPADRCSIW